MIIVFIMFCMMTLSPQGESLYKAPLTRAVDATYQGSQLKHMLDNKASDLKSDYPIPITLGALSYSAVINKRLLFSTPRVNIFNQKVTSFYVDKTQAYMTITWSL